MSGVAKGSGMIHPNMATMLGFITTDVSITPSLLQTALSADVETSFNQITIDGDTSTNDTVLVMANGGAQNPPITTENDDFSQFKVMLNTVTTALAIAIANDGEGATKLLTVTVNHAQDGLGARMVAKKSLARPSSKQLFLVKILTGDVSSQQLALAALTSIPISLTLL